MKSRTTDEKALPNKELRKYIKSFPASNRTVQEGVSYYNLLKDKLFISYAVKRGVSYQLFSEIKANSPFDENQWSGFLNLNIRTLQRYKMHKDHIFKPSLSERIFELAEVISHGNRVFDTAEDFSTWLNTPSLALDRNKAVDLLDNSYGIDLVIEELNRIEHGVFV